MTLVTRVAGVGHAADGCADLECVWRRYYATALVRIEDRGGLCLQAEARLLTGVTAALRSRGAFPGSPVV